MVFGIHKNLSLSHIYNFYILTFDLMYSNRCKGLYGIREPMVSVQLYTINRHYL